MKTLDTLHGSAPFCKSWPSGQRRDRIQITEVDSGRILRFSFGPGSGTGVKNFSKTGLGSGVTF